MLDFEQNKIMYFVFFIAILAGLYFIHTYHTTYLINKELKKTFKKIDNPPKYQHPKPQQQPQPNIYHQPLHAQHQEQQNDNQDIDSYIGVDENNQKPHVDSSSRLTTRNVMMRDMVDGSH